MAFGVYRIFSLHEILDLYHVAKFGFPRSLRSNNLPQLLGLLRMAYAQGSHDKRWCSSKGCNYVDNHRFLLRPHFPTLMSAVTGHASNSESE
jgi:hypothetical protein